MALVLRSIKCGKKGKAANMKKEHAGRGISKAW
jgi:hypothetical protein